MSVACDVEIIWIGFKSIILKSKTNEVRNKLFVESVRNFPRFIKDFESSFPWGKY